MGTRKWLITSVAGLIALAGAGAGSFAAVRANAGQVGSAPCPVSYGRCIPSMRSADVISALKAKGHECAIESTGWLCTIRIGDASYEARLRTPGGQLASAYVSTRSATDGITRGAKAYMSWFAELPFADDPQMVAYVDDWLTQQIDAGKKVTAEIAGYRYELNASNSKGYVTFDVEGLES
jgi:hypothetical protein